MLHSSAELAFVRAKVKAGQEPWKSAWDQMQKSRYASLSFQPCPERDVVRDLPVTTD